MPEIAILGREGHVVVVWNSADEAEVARAREEFERLRAAGYALFAVEQEVEAFDPAKGPLDARYAAPAEPVAGSAPEVVTTPRRKLKAVQTETLDPDKRHLAVPRMRGGDDEALEAELRLRVADRRWVFDTLARLLAAEGWAIAPIIPQHHQHLLAGFTWDNRCPTCVQRRPTSIAEQHHGTNDLAGMRAWAHPEER